MKPIVALVLATFVFAGTAGAQSTGLIRGVVKDADGRPIEGAKVTITTTDEVNRKFETKTGKNGDYLQIGLPTGTYTVTVDKGNLSQSKPMRVSNGDPSDLNFVLAPVAAPEAPPPGNAAEFQKTFAEGVEAARAGRPDEAVAKFTRAHELNPNCTTCSSNLATIYYSQGVSSWTAGKIADAKKQFEAAVTANPNHAESHFQLGMVLLNENDIPAAVDQFDTYLKLAPTGPNAEQAKAAVTALGKK